MTDDYDKNREAFNRVAKRMQDHARAHGINMSHEEAQKKLRKHIKKSKNK